MILTEDWQFFHCELNSAEEHAHTVTGLRQALVIVYCVNRHFNSVVCAWGKWIWRSLSHGMTHAFTAFKLNTGYTACSAGPGLCVCESRLHTSLVILWCRFLQQICGSPEDCSAPACRATKAANSSSSSAFNTNCSDMIHVEADRKNRKRTCDVRAGIALWEIFKRTLKICETKLQDLN